jgi:nicotinate-nucleotide--dimethylbenzimidazole phosphoribosyltransferase
MTMTTYHTPIDAINTDIAANLQHVINNKTKPLGALGALESVALQVGQIQNTLAPKLNRPTMLVFAGDHGIVEAGVSPYPQAVTAQMVLNFLAGGAAINVFARQHNVALRVVDSGVNAEFEPTEQLTHAKIARSTNNFLHSAAMTMTQCEQALTTGAEIAYEEADAGSNVIGFGEMGIGNTSSASCLMSVLCDIPIAKCVGRGTGLDDAGVQRKVVILEKALAHHHLDNSTPIKVLAALGGFEIAMMVGAMLGAAQRNCVLLIDGFIATSALLVAAKMQPTILQYCIFSHCSDEAGHQLMLNHLHAKPLLNLGLRLGEGTGAVLTYPLVQSAVNFLNEMASFAEAGVSEQSNAS